MWTIPELELALGKQAQVQDGSWAMEELGGSSHCLVVTSTEHGGAEIFITVDEDQMLMSALLFPLDAVSDRAALNEELLRTHKLLPLSTVGITEVPDAGTWYELFGALSNQSTIENVVLELETLLGNYLQVAEAYADKVNTDAASAA